MKKTLPQTNQTAFSFVAALFFIFISVVFCGQLYAQDRIVEFNTPGTFTWKVPCGATNVKVYVWGAGGGGGGAQLNLVNDYRVGGGGGSGAFIWNAAVPFVADQVFTIKVGAGGQGGKNGSNYGNGVGNGGNGDSSSFNSHSGFYLRVGGGKAGLRNPTGSGGERGYVLDTETGSWGTIGGNGANGSSTLYGGGGAASGAPNFNGAVGGSGATGAIAALGPFPQVNGGSGGNGQSGANGDGADGMQPGGGGGGARRSDPPTTGNYEGGDGGHGKVVITYNGAPYGYCNKNYTTVEPITNVTFAGINNTTDPTVGDSPVFPALERFCSLSANVAKGTTYPITVKGNTDGPHTDYFRVYFDWNQDGVFSAAERTDIGSITNSTGTDAAFATINITVPNIPTVLLGKTMMRVVKNYYDYTNACSDVTYGQAEDYMVNVSGACQPPTGATANYTNTSLTVCAGTEVTLRQTGGAISADQEWEWTKATCTSVAENINSNTNAEYTFTPTGAGTTVFLVKVKDKFPSGSCGTTGPCQSVTVIVVAQANITINSGYTNNFSVCKTVAPSTIHAVFTITGGATGATATGLPAGITGTYSSGTFTISGTPDVGVAVGTYNYTINLTGNSPCVNPTIGGTITVTDKPSFNYAGGPFTYCLNSSITPNEPTVGTGGLPTTFTAASLPAGLTIDGSTGTISGTPTVNSPLTNYTIRASNSCGQTDVVIQIQVITGNTVFNLTHTGTSPICSNSSGVNIGLNGSVSGINYQLYRDGTPVAGAVFTGTGAAFNFPGLYNIAGTYTVVATSGCATNMSGSFILNVTPEPSAQFNYSSSTFCKSGTNPVPTISGTPTTGGTFTSSPAGLALNASTGEINLLSSNIGTYTVVYNVPALGGCLPYTSSSKTVIIADAPSRYNITGGGSYCSGGAGHPVGLSNSETGVSYQLYRDGTPVGSAIPGTTGSAISWGNQTVVGTYTAQATLTPCIETMIGEVDIIVNPLPAAIAVTPAAATVCQGSVIALTATSTPPSTTPGNATVSSGTINQGIPDNNTVGTSYLFRVTTVPAGATITSVSLEFYITHPYVGDLIMNLKGPNGNVLNIFNGQSGNDGDNFGTSTPAYTMVSSNATNSISTGSAPYIANNPYSPAAVASIIGATSVPANTSNVFTFDGLYGSSSLSANGNWYFSIRDKGGWDVGQLRFCRLIINYTIVNNSTNVKWAPSPDLYTDPAATVPYINGASASTVFVKPSSTGTQTYTAINSNAFSCQTTASANLLVNPSPVIYMKADYCSVPNKVRISAHSTVTINSGNWIWNTGSTGTNTTPDSGYVSANYIDVDVSGSYFVSAKAASGNCPATGSISIAQELTTNGNFELGNTGFSTGYTYVNPSPVLITQNPPSQNNPLWPEVHYGVGTDGKYYHNRFFGYDHTFGTGTGNFMLVNGYDSLTLIWQNANIPIQPNTEYYFSAWGISLNAVPPYGELRFRINGQNVGSTLALTAGNESSSAANNNWKKFHGSWNSGSATSATVEIRNLKNHLGGNDFGIDDISFGTLTAFFNLISDPATATQNSVCAGTPIAEIMYEIGGDGNPPNTSGSLPPGVSTYWNGRNFRISGTPTLAAAGTYNYSITSTGCAPQTKNVSITVIPASESGNFASSVLSACFNTTGSISVSGSVGTIYTWQSSTDGINGWANVAGGPYTTSYSYPALTSARYYRVIAQNTAACNEDTSAVVKLGLKNVWTGNTNNNWNVATNWSDEQLPSKTPCNTVIIPVLSSRPYPVLSGGSSDIYNLLVEPTASVTILNDGILRIEGGITSNAAINANDGTIEMNGATQTISGSNFVGKNIERLIVSGTQLNVSSTPNDTLNITEKLSFNTTAGLNTGDNITLKSTLNKTASVGMLNTGNSISGRFTVERIIRHFQNWNMITLPVRENISVRDSWQEGGAIFTSNGFGTRITGPASPAPVGLDVPPPTPGYSLKWWDHNLSGGAGNWVGVFNSTTELANRPQGFFIFVRGDRGIAPGPAGSITTLRGKGTIYDATNVPSLSVTAPANTKVTLANPYASAIQINKLVTTHGNNSKLQPHIWVWDPTLWGHYGVGGYQTISAPTGSVVTPGGGAIYNSGNFPNIQSGHAVYVQTTVANPIIAFNEDMKVDSSRQVQRGGSPETINNVDPSQVSMLSTHLYATDGRMYDGNRVVFDDIYSDEVDMNDAEKINNSYVNFGLKRFNKSLIVEARSSLKATDTLYYNMSGLPTGNFKLGVSVQNIHAPHLRAELIDNYLHTRTPVSLTDSSFVNFSTTADAGSKAANRFLMVFQPSQVVLPVTFVQVAAQRNADRSIDVQWKVANEVNIVRYEVERSADSRNFSGILTRDAANYDTYRQTDLSPLAEDNFYRIKAIGLAGDITYSNTVKVAPEKSPALIVVSPNPVKGKQMNVRFVKQPAGEYQLVLTNNNGSEIYRGSVTVSSGSLIKTIALHPSTAGGAYRLAVFNKNGDRVAVEQVMVE